VSTHTKEDPVALAQAVLSDPAMDQALTWLVELGAATPAKQEAFEAWIEADPAHRAAFHRAQAIWDSQSVRDAASSL